MLNMNLKKKNIVITDDSSMLNFLFRRIDIDKVNIYIYVGKCPFDNKYKFYDIRNDKYINLEEIENIRSKYMTVSQIDEVVDWKEATSTIKKNYKHVIDKNEVIKHLLSSSRDKRYAKKK